MQRFDGLQNEIQQQDRIPDQERHHPHALEARHRGDDVHLRQQQERQGVEPAHDDQGESRLTVADVDQVVGLVRGVDQGPVALPAIELARRVEQPLEVLLFELQLGVERVLPRADGVSWTDSEGESSELTPWVIGRRTRTCN